MIRPTLESLQILRRIADDVPTFHRHYHVLYDIAKSYPDARKVVYCEIGTFKGAYPLIGCRTWDSALRFTAGMYIPGTFMCVSFTGPYKHLKLSKGGAILTDDQAAHDWFKRSRFSGRRECSYHEDALDMIGWNFYMMPELAARGLLLLSNFYERDGTPKHNEDLEIEYPDLSQFAIYQNAARQ